MLPSQPPASAADDIFESVKLELFTGNCKVVPPITPTGCACYWNSSDTGCACCSANKQEHCCQVGKANKHACAKCVHETGKDTANEISRDTYRMAQIGWLKSFGAALKNKLPHRDVPFGLIPNFAVHGTGRITLLHFTTPKSHS